MERNVHGFTVKCQILGDDAEGYTLQVLTSHSRTSPTESEWQVPEPCTYGTREEAERQAKYVVLGIDSVEPSGKPKFTVT